MPGTEETTERRRPKVSVVALSYNHEAYIRQALDGFLAQEVDFEVEFVVADDASTDSTAAIITEYAARDPERFRPILRSVNVGVHVNEGEALAAARGEYIALCEGDDYWTDPRKLSRQVAYLDAHPEISVCFHPVQVLWEGSAEQATVFPTDERRGDMSLYTLLARNFIQTNSVVYRRLPDYDGVFPDGVMPLDWYLHLRHAKEGGIAMLPETMAVYRRHAAGMWSDSAGDRPEFWTRHGPGHAALAEALLDLFPDDTAAQAAIAPLAGRTFGALSKLDDEHGRALLTSTARAHPRAEALGIRWLQTRVEQLDDRVSETTERIRVLDGRILDLRAGVEKQRNKLARQEERLQIAKARISKLRDRVRRLKTGNAALRDALRTERERRVVVRAKRLTRHISTAVRGSGGR